MLAYSILIVTSILVGFAAVLLARPNSKFNPKTFLTGALLNAGTLLGILFYQRRRRS